MLTLLREISIRLMHTKIKHLYILSMSLVIRPDLMLSEFGAVVEKCFPFEKDLSKI